MTRALAPLMLLVLLMGGCTPKKEAAPTDTPLPLVTSPQPKQADDVRPEPAGALRELIMKAPRGEPPAGADRRGEAH